MSELNGTLLDVGPPLIEYSKYCVWDANCDQCHLYWNIWLVFNVNCLDRMMDNERLEGELAKCRWVKKEEIKHSQPAVSSMCMCVFLRVARFCILYALCCFLPSRSPAMGNLIKVLGKDLENCPHFFLDFESKWARRGVCARVCVLENVSAHVCSRGVQWEDAGWGHGRCIWMWAAALLIVCWSVVVGVVCHHQMLSSPTLSAFRCWKRFYPMMV